MSTITLTIERIPRTLTINSQPVVVEELGIRLPFARKPADLDEVGGHGQTKVFVTETRVMTPAEFDAFARSLMASRDWLTGKGGGVKDEGESGYLCVEVTAPGRPYLYVNPEGSDYARYVARLG
jgi:hypothetical protein